MFANEQKVDTPVEGHLYIHFRRGMVQACIADSASC